MNPDELKQAWKTVASQQRLTIEPARLLDEVRRNQRHLETTLFWRDVREVGVCLVMVPVWIWLGRNYALPWSWHLGIPALLWIAGFMLADRMRQRRRQPKPGNPLRECVEASLAQVEHQILLLRNVVWWYLLPPGIAMAAFFAQCAWVARDTHWLAELFMVGVVIVAVWILWGVYWLNQRAVRDQLEPRRRELLALRESLGEPTSGDAPVGRTGTGGSSSRGSERGGALWLLLLCIAVLAMAVCSCRPAKPAPAHQDTKPQPTTESLAQDPAVTDVLVRVRQTYDVPAICAAIVTSKGVVAAGVTGVRKRDTEIPATLDDLWHLGSDTKAMTATLAARLVEQNKLKWETSVADVFPDLADKFHPEMKAVTLLHFSRTARVCGRTLTSRATAATT